MGLDFFLLSLCVLGHAVVIPAGKAWGTSQSFEGVCAMTLTLVLQSVAWAILAWRLDPGSSAQKDNISLKRALWLGILLSIVLAASVPPVLETDWYRYFWDGLQVSHGISPYIHPPAILPWDPWAPLRAQINFPELSTIYPMGAQWVFAAATKLSFSQPFLFVRILAVGGWIAAAISLQKLSARMGGDRYRLLLVLLHPLLIREWIHAAHYDSWMMAAICFALAIPSAIGRGFLLGLATQIKVLAAVVLLPSLLTERLTSRRGEGSRFPFKHLLGFFLGFILLFVSVFLLQGGDQWEGALTSWRSFAGQWEMNSGPARWVREALYALTEDYDGSRLEARGIVAGIYIISILALAGRFFRRDKGSLAQQQALIDFSFLALFLAPWLSPVFNTWYATWSLILLSVIRRDWFKYATLLYIPVGLGDFFYIIEKTPWFSIESWWDLEHAWISGILLALVWVGRASQSKVQRS